MSTRVRVRVSYDVWVDLPSGCDDYDDGNLHFMIEENSCPGTGVVGHAVSVLHAYEAELDEKHTLSRSCWACALRGENKIQEIVRDARTVKIGDRVMIAGFHGPSEVTEISPFGFRVRPPATEPPRLGENWWTVDDIDDAASPARKS